LVADGLRLKPTSFAHFSRAQYELNMAAILLVYGPIKHLCVHVPLTLAGIQLVEKKFNTFQKLPFPGSVDVLSYHNKRPCI
jgi:hypothetical protein